MLKVYTKFSLCTKLSLCELHSEGNIHARCTRIITNNFKNMQLTLINTIQEYNLPNLHEDI